MAWNPSSTDLNQIDDLEVLQNFSFTITYSDSKYGFPQPVTITPTTQSFPTVQCTSGTVATISGFYQYLFEGSVIQYKMTQYDDNSIQTVTQPDEYTNQIWDFVTEGNVYAMTSFKADRTLKYDYYYLAVAPDSQRGQVQQTYHIVLTNTWDAGQRAFKDAVTNSKQVLAEK